MCESSDEDMPHDPNRFSTVSSPSEPSGSSEPQDSITANPLLERLREAGPRPEHDNSQKRKRAKGEPEELENSPPAKRLQPEQQSIPTPFKTPSGTAAHQLSSSPLQSWDPGLDMPEPSAGTERPSTPPRYSSPSFQSTARPVRDISKSTHTRISQQSTEEQDILNRRFSSPSREIENIWFPQDPHEKRGRDLLLLMEKVPEKERDQLVQLVPYRLEERPQRCWAKCLCFSDGTEVNVLAEDHKRFLIKINWPQVTSGERAGRTFELYHIRC